MSNQIISIDQLSETVSKELENYNNVVIKGIKEAAKRHMERLVKDTKATAPVGKRKKHYKNNITSKKTAENALEVEYTWYVKGKDYRLSHLLENGHATRNGGRTRGTHFIKNASEPILESYVDAVEEVCRDGK